MGAFLLWLMRDIIPAFLGAVVMYVLFRPLFAVFLVKWNFPKWLATLSVVALSFLLLVLPFVVVGFMITDKVQLFLEQTDSINAILYRVQDYIGYDFHDPATLNKLVQSVQGTLFGSVSSIISGVGGMFLTVAILYFILWFMLMNYKSSTFGNVLGQGAICLVQATLLSIGFVIFGLEDPIFWGTITFFVSFLPVVGAPLVFVPAGLIALAYGDSYAGYGIMIYGFVLVTNIDNVMRLFISRYFADSHPLITILGVIAGIPVFGILGLVFGPLLISWFLLLTRILIKSETKVGA
jgi:predicted PurR-regulated permease PerM